MNDHDDFWDSYGYCDFCGEEHYGGDYGHGWDGCDSGWNSHGSNVPYLSDGSSEGCYIATAVYGSYDCPEVWVLRRFRDYGLRKCAIGRSMIRAYYSVSPKLVKRFGHIEKLKCAVRSILNVFVQRLKKRGYEDTAYYER